MARTRDSAYGAVVDRAGLAVAGSEDESGRCQAAVDVGDWTGEIAPARGLAEVKRLARISRAELDRARDGIDDTVSTACAGNVLLGQRGPVLLRLESACPARQRWRSHGAHASRPDWDATGRSGRREPRRTRKRYALSWGVHVAVSHGGTARLA